jgi:hypothetical protein
LNKNNNNNNDNNTNNNDEESANNGFEDEYMLNKCDYLNLQEINHLTLKIIDYHV